MDILYNGGLGIPDSDYGKEKTSKVSLKLAHQINGMSTTHPSDVVKWKSNPAKSTPRSPTHTATKHSDELLDGSLLQLYPEDKFVQSLHTESGCFGMRIWKGKFTINTSYMTSNPCKWVVLDDYTIPNNKKSDKRSAGHVYKIKIPEDKQQAIKYYLGIDYDLSAIKTPKQSKHIKTQHQYPPKHLSLQSYPILKQNKTGHKQKNVSVGGGNTIYNSPHIVAFSNLAGFRKQRDVIRKTLPPSGATGAIDATDVFDEYITKHMFHHKRVIEESFDKNIPLNTNFQIPMNITNDTERLNVLYLISAPLYPLTKRRLGERVNCLLQYIPGQACNLKDIFKARNRNVHVYNMHIIDHPEEFYKHSKNLRGVLNGIEGQLGKQVFDTETSLRSNFVHYFQTYLNVNKNNLLRSNIVFDDDEKTLTLLGYDHINSTHLTVKEQIQNQLRKFLDDNNINMIFAEGGETHWLSRLLHISGFSEVMHETKYRKKITWSGQSAGIVNGSYGTFMTAGKQFLLQNFLLQNPSKFSIDDVNALVKKTSNDFCVIPSQQNKTSWINDVKENCLMKGLNFYPRVIYPHYPSDNETPGSEYYRYPFLWVNQENKPDDDKESRFVAIGDGECFVYPSFRLDSLNTMSALLDENIKLPTEHEFGLYNRAISQPHIAQHVLPDERNLMQLIVTTRKDQMNFDVQQVGVQQTKYAKTGKRKNSSPS